LSQTTNCGNGGGAENPFRAARQMQHCALRSKARYAQEGKPMKAWSAIGLLLGAAILATIPVSPQVTTRGVEVSAEQAVTYGRYRRVTRRAYRRGGYAATAGYGATAAGYGYGGAGYGYGGPGYRVEPAGPGRSCAVYPSGFQWCWTELAFGPTNALNPQPLPPAPTQAVNPQPLPPRR
jgi:hypothetical protein